MSNPNVKRYGFKALEDYEDWIAVEFEDANGDWVKYSSYQSLELENKRLRVALEKIFKNPANHFIQTLAGEALEGGKE